MCVNNLPKVVTWQRSWPESVTRLARYHYTNIQDTLFKWRVRRNPHPTALVIEPHKCNCQMASEFI